MILLVSIGLLIIIIVGRDTILQEARNIYEVLDLGFGKCRMCVCGLIFFVVCFPLSTLATRWEASLKERKGKADPALRAVKRTALKEAA